MTGINVNVKEIFRKFGLQARKIEPVVYEILNTSKEVSIDELQWELEECVLITSDRIRSRKLESGILLSSELDAPAPCRLNAPDLDFACRTSADCLHQHQQVI